MIGAINGLEVRNFLDNLSAASLLSKSFETRVPSFLQMTILRKSPTCVVSLQCRRLNGCQSSGYVTTLLPYCQASLQKLPWAPQWLTSYWFAKTFTLLPSESSTPERFSTGRLSELVSDDSGVFHSSVKGNIATASSLNFYASSIYGWGTLQCTWPIRVRKDGSFCRPRSEFRILKRRGKVGTLQERRAVQLHFYMSSRELQCVDVWKISSVHLGQETNVGQWMSRIVWVSQALKYV